MEEVLPGILGWSALHEKIKIRVFSSYVVESATLIDPMVPEQGLEAFDGLPAPERIVLTNRHHWRHSTRFVEAFGCSVWCHEAGMHEFADGREVRPFAFGDELAPGIAALEVDAICPEETALLIATGGGALSIADGVIRSGGDGELCFVPDFLIGDDPEPVKRELRAAYARLLDRGGFDALLFAHGAPIPHGGAAALRDFVNAP